MSLLNLKNYLVIFLLGFAYLYGILSPQHYSPSSHDFYINTFVFLFCSIGTAVFFLREKIQLYFSDMLWLIIFIIILIQPLLNNIIYVDGLIFPLATMLICFFLSVLTKNTNEEFTKEKIIYCLGVVIVLGAFLLYLTQLVHVFKLYIIVEYLGLPLQEKRFSGNLYQPNQTAFVYVLGISSSIFLINNKPKYFWLGILYIVVISSGVALTFSRTGLIMLFITVFMYNIYSNYNNKISFLKLKYAYSAILGLLIGLLISTNLVVSEQLVQRTLKSLEDPRVSLFKKSVYILIDQPLFGIGWKNFASTNFDYYASLHWVGLADHSHFIFTQLLSEFGLIFGGCIIILFGFVFFKGLKKISDPLYFYIFTILLTFIIYSLFEFPLWDFRYLFIFVLFLGFFTRSEKYLFVTDKGVLFSIILLGMAIFSLYYLYEYRKVAYVHSILVDPSRSNNEKSMSVMHLNNTIGFSSFKEQLLYQTIVPDGYMLAESIIIGERVTHYTPSSEFLVKQGTLLALDFQHEKALYYFKLACKNDWNRKCNTVQAQVNQLYQQHPKYFEYIYKNLKN